MTLAASVLPTPASPSMKSGFSSFKARKIDVARARSPMYLRSRNRCSTSSIVAGEGDITPKAYEFPDVSLPPLGEGGPRRSGWSDEGRCRLLRATETTGPARTPGPVPLLRLLDRSLREHPSQVLLVLGARPEVAGRV